jgi:alpha-mannosidase
MTYSLLPHEGSWRKEVVPAAYDLNDPLMLRRVDGAASAASVPGSLVAVNVSNVIIETVKMAEDGSGLIVRLFENERSRSKVRLTVGFKLTAAYVCNLLEENQRELSIDGHTVQIDITPYQIQTLRLVAE